MACVFADGIDLIKGEVIVQRKEGGEGHEHVSLRSGKGWKLVLDRG